PFGRVFLHLDLSLRFSVACLCGPSVRADLEVIMAKNTAAIKRNNRKIHARKFLATPEGKDWLVRKQEEEAEIKLARAANAMF
ncbi:hypothetical protein LAV69_20415, partial [Klebsiella quasipneumoniae subsp. quasipneumoniae]